MAILEAIHDSIGMVAPLTPGEGWQPSREQSSWFPAHDCLGQDQPSDLYPIFTSTYEIPHTASPRDLASSAIMGEMQSWPCQGRENSQEDIELLGLTSPQSGSFDGKSLALRGKDLRLAVLLYRSDSVDKSR